jgi:DNA-binding IscR family transcriptional regulator
LNSSGQLTDESDIAYQILSYLHANPDAQDTLEGIVEWWLLHQNIQRQIQNVQQTLAELTERGLITVRTGADSRARYGIKRDRREEIESFLKNWPRSV